MKKRRMVPRDCKSSLQNQQAQARRKRSDLLTHLLAQCVAWKRQTKALHGHIRQQVPNRVQGSRITYTDGLIISVQTLGDGRAWVLELHAISKQKSQLYCTVLVCLISLLALKARGQHGTASHPNMAMAHVEACSTCMKPAGNAQDLSTHWAGSAWRHCNTGGW